MSTTSPATIDEIYLAASELDDGAARATFLDQACAGHPDLRQRVERLLRAQPHAEYFLESVAAPGLVPAVNQPTDDKPLGTSIGPYKLREVLGEGGMGIVYAAEQEQPIHRKVALKVIKPGMDSREIIARLEVERQALALMDHPNIAKVIDAGTTDTGRPYFVMELVCGMPITEYCDQAKLNLRDRLKLFISICQAVQHAHQKGIIHRDLKPSNVMITLHDGVPVVKIIDFGVAKALNQKLTEQTLYTRNAQLIGTPLYMSPEQAELSGLDIDTRSDVYSLGVLLYELLTGQTPFDRETFSKLGYDELRRMIREDEPPRPSQRVSTLGSAKLSTIAERRGSDDRHLAMSLRGELDWIVMKALEKDRTRRYESPNAFATDVESYLNDQPVQACPLSTSYRVLKFARKNRAVLSVAAVVAAVLVAGIAVSSWQALRALRAQSNSDKQQALAKASEQHARANLRKAREAVDQMLLRVSQELASVPKMEPVRRELLADALDFYEAFLEENSGDPDIRFERSLVYLQQGEVQRMLGEINSAEQSFVEAIQILKDLLNGARSNPATRAALVHVYNALGALLDDDAGRVADSEAARQQALAISQKLADELPNQYRAALADQLNSMGCLLYRKGRLSEAESRHREALEIRWECPDAADGEPLSVSLFNLALVLNASGQVEEAKSLYRQELELARRIADANLHDPQKWARLSESQSNFGICLNTHGSRGEAEQLLRDCIAIRKGLASEFPNVPSYRYSLGVAHLNLGVILAESGRFPEAEQAYRTSLPIAEQLAAEFPNFPMYRELVGHAQHNLGDAALAVDRWDDAMSAFRQAQILFSVLVHQVPDKPDLCCSQSKAMVGFGLSLSEREKPSQADFLIRKGLAIAENLVANYPDASDYREALGYAYGAMGIVRYRLGDWAGAIQSFEKVLEKVSDTQDDGESLFFVAMAHWQIGDKEQARQSYDTAVKWVDKKEFKHPRLLRIEAEAERLMGLSEYRDEPADALSTRSTDTP